MAENNLTTLAIGNALARCAEGITKESFPLHVFPQKMQKLILHLVRHRNFKLEFVASCMLTAAAAAIGWILLRIPYKVSRVVLQKHYAYVCNRHHLHQI